MFQLDIIIYFQANLSDLRIGAHRNIPTGLSITSTLKHEYEKLSDRSLLAGFHLGVCQIIKEGGEIDPARILQIIGQKTYTRAKADPQDCLEKLTRIVQILKEETQQKFQELQLKFEERVQQLEHTEQDAVNHDERVKELTFLKAERDSVVQKHQMRVLLCQSM